MRGKAMQEITSMELRVVSRDSLLLCGYYVDTCLEDCGKDIAALWDVFNAGKDDLYNAFGHRSDLYGLMWYTQNHRYCYLIGMEANESVCSPAGASRKNVPPARYAVVRVPASASAVDAWTEFYKKTIPEAGFAPDAAHGFNFEYYPDGADRDYELWTPISG